ncbi:hypothetical protein NC652_023472 [Populus alba x Populus x berolinensis]|nr:hypothetical protein NC652_023472 [Populus alba x Populus x berolinensis]
MTITTTNRRGGGRSLDLLVKFVSNVFKKVSKRARKAVRSVLPVPLSTKLVIIVEFSVNGVLLPAFLWVLKAFLEVILGMLYLIFSFTSYISFKDLSRMIQLFVMQLQCACLLQLCMSWVCSFPKSSKM